MPKNVEKLKGKAQQVVIHHTVTESAPNNEVKTIKSIQSSHMTDRNFDDIGYK